MTIKEIEFIVTNLPTEKTPVTNLPTKKTSQRRLKDSFTGGSSQTVKENYSSTQTLPET